MLMSNNKEARNIKSYRVDFRVESHAPLNLSGKVSDKIEVTENRQSEWQYTFAVYTEAKTHEDSVTIAASALTVCLDICSFLLNSGAQIIPNSQVNAWENEEGQFITAYSYVTPRDAKTVTSEEIKLLLEALKNVSEIVSKPPNKYLIVALEFFTRSMWEEYPENRIIDAFVAFEALYSTDEISELSYKLSHRVAVLIGTDDSNRRVIFNRMRVLYVKRSKIVHGKDPKLESADIGDTHRYLADSLARFVMLAGQYSQEQIIDLLDDALIDGGKRTELRTISTPTFWARS